jgi:hypothetical protein
MTRKLSWSALLLVALAGGCGQQVDDETPQQPAPPPEPPPERLGEHIDVSLVDLLGKSRAELAAVADEWTVQAQIQEKYRRERRVEYSLLPEARFPLIVPVLREASFLPQAGLSLPPYIAEGTTDSDLALHLARYGDVEAARKLVDPKDTAAREQIEACRYERNYPVEWTRAAGLMLQVAQMRLAQGETDAATELVMLHQQLKEALGEKAAAGPLGAALLPPGRQALAQAASAWRGPKRTAQLADDIETALATWGEAPVALPAIAPGAARADVARLLRSPGQGRVIPALATRALDLLDLPLPPDGAQAVLAMFDASERLSEVLVIYRTGVAAMYRGPRDLASYLEQRDVAGKDDRGPGLVMRSYEFGKFTCEVVVVSRGSPVGGFVRIAGGKSEAGTLPRDFGVVHLDQGFEQNRMHIASETVGAVLRSERPAVLAQVKSPLRRVKPNRVSVERAGDTNATARILLRHGADPVATVHEAALRLWAEAGPARIVGQEDEGGGHLAFVWEDGRTRVTMRWPFTTGEGLELDAEDATGTDPARRAADAAEFDRRARQERLAAGKPLTRLPRHLDYDGVRLGAARAEAVQGLPRGEFVVKQSVPGGVTVNFTGEAPKGSTHVVRQSFVRWDPQGNVVELRMRYGEGAAGGNWIQTLVNGLKQRFGAPAEPPATWAPVWSDMPARKPAAALYRWQDDLTLLTCQRDAWGAEVTLRDASGPEPSLEPVPLPEYLPRGPVGEVAVGASRADVLRTAGDKPQALGDGALVVAPKAPVPYDVLLVYFDGDRATRVVARYKQPAPPRATPAQLTKQLTEAWGRDARDLGWPVRQDVTDAQALQGLAWHDEHTRVRLFWQEAESGPQRLYGEWKELKP